MNDWRHGTRRRGLGAWALTAMFALLSCVTGPAGAAGIPLEGAWMPAAPGQLVDAVEATDPRLQRFDPARLNTFAAPAEARILLLWPAQGAWPDPPWVLEAIEPGLQRATLYAGEGDAGSETWIGSRDRPWPGHGRLSFLVDDALPATTPLRIRLDATGVIPPAMHFAVRSVPDHLRADARWLALASACLAIMAAMAIVALFFGARLRDPAFVHYAVYVAAYAFILALQGGYVFEPLGWYVIAEAPRAWGRIATVASVVAAVLFLVRFANLAQCAPRMRQLLLGYAATVALVGTVGSLPWSGAFGRALINPLLIAGAPLLLVASTLAAARGSRYAVFFLCGWTPLLAVTVLGSAQLYGVASGWTWAADAALVAGAFEALVLSLGLADRALALRRAHEQARRLADIDPLTGLYNRRAWSQRLPEAERDVRARGVPLALLFLDLDGFKQLNDRHGHDAGDNTLRALAVVLRAELRDEDLIGRYGGEEFVVALPGADEAHALQVAERIRQRLKERSLLAVGVECTVSIGVAALQPHEDTSQLLRRADEAMYAAKDAGRNRVMLSPPGDAALQS